MLLRQLGGAIAGVPTDATAFALPRCRPHADGRRRAGPRGEDPAPHGAWARDLWEAMRRISTGGAYVNQLDADEGTDRVREAYGVPTWASLVALKRRLDPDNVFRLNQNIPPGPVRERARDA